MKKILQAIALLLCLLLLLTACGAKPAEEESAPVARHTASPQSETPAPAPTEEPAPAPTEEPAPAPTEPPVDAHEVERVAFDRRDDGQAEHVLLTGVAANGEAVWQKEYGTDYRTELTLIEEIGVWQDRYYFNHHGTVVCLRLADGEELWQNDEFGGASISSQIDPRDGRVYLCGWYGPDFFACGADGQTQYKDPNVAEGFYWPSDMTWAGSDELAVYYRGGAAMEIALPFYVQLSDYSMFWEFGREDMDADSQYWANIFISDFAEQFISEFPRDSGSDAELSSFAHRFCKINRYSAITYENGYETVALDTVNELCMRFFGREIHPTDGTQYTNEWGMQWKFENGKFYFPAADGESYNRFAVVNDYLRLPGGNVILSFDVYELKLEEYWDKGMDSSLYSLTADKAAAIARTGRITCVGVGAAEVLPIEQSGHDGYHLYRLHVDRY